ncbi:MAG: hypothetical protein MUO76_08805 [Anaerolineaceae bacterium]|nr:hypothetical protein [Anaerolineaceae bacterium]
MEIVDLVWMVVGFFLTLLVFSYVLGDNFLFRLVSYIFIGVAAGYLATLVIYQVLYPRLVLPLIAGSLSERAVAAVPLVLGILLLLKLFPRLTNVGSIPMGFLVGIGAAVTIGGAIMGTLFGQIEGSFASFDLEPAGLSSGSPFSQVLEGLLLLLGTVTTLAYFHFGAATRQAGSNERAKWINTLAKIGQVFIAITLGALFAGVYIAAVTALIDRMDFIKNVILKILAL